MADQTTSEPTDETASGGAAGSGAAPRRRRRATSPTTTPAPAPAPDAAPAPEKVSAPEKVPAPAVATPEVAGAAPRSGGTADGAEGAEAAAPPARTRARRATAKASAPAGAEVPAATGTTDADGAAGTGDEADAAASRPKRATRRRATTTKAVGGAGTADGTDTSSGPADSPTGADAPGDQGAGGPTVADASVSADADAGDEAPARAPRQRATRATGTRRRRTADAETEAGQEPVADGTPAQDRTPAKDEQPAKGEKPAGDEKPARRRRGRAAADDATSEVAATDAVEPRGTAADRSAGASSTAVLDVIAELGPPTEQPTTTGGTNPRLAATALLFQAPEPRRRRRAQAPAGPPVPVEDEATTEDDETPTETVDPTAVDLTTGDETVTVGEDGEDGEDSDGTDGTDDADDAETDDGDGAGSGDDDGDEDDGPARRRRRRRGGRGRRSRSHGDDRGSDGSDDSDGSDASESTDGDDGDEEAHDAEGTDRSDGSDGSGRPASGGRRRSRGGRGGSGSGSGAAPATDTDADGDDESADTGDDTDGDESTSSSSRRRRRRRSRSGEPGESREGRGGARSDEVTALKGSTRLEAKRQRRREGRDAGRRRTIVTEAEFLARREAVDRDMVVRESDGRIQIAVLEDDVLVEHFVARTGGSTAATGAGAVTMVGNIYLGRVQNVLPSMEAAFVDVGKGRNAVLYAGEVNWDAAGLEGQPRRIEQALKSGDSVLVQVTKDPIGHKGARLTSQITLAGRYLVYVPGGGMTGISRKLPDTERARLKKLLREIVPDDAGVIVRTAAEGASDEDLSRDVQRLQDQWAAVQRKAKSASAPAILHGEPDLAIRVVRDIFNDDFRSLVVQGEQVHRTISDYVSSMAPDLADRVSRWTGERDVFAERRVDEQLTKALDRKVWLPSGGSLVIDRTEAMTVIDVNTGKFTGSGGTLEETVTRNNLEAAEEIVRQLRLRDIGGMIVVDFIDMVLESNRDLVLRRLVECLGRDRTKHQVAEVTSLGLVQMTRKRVGQGLFEAFNEPCEHCQGRGFVIHDEPVVKGGSGEAEPQGEPRRSRRKKSGSGGSGAGGGNGSSDKGSAVPVLPEAREAVKATLATIAAAAAHAHEHVGEDGQEGAREGHGGAPGQARDDAHEPATES